VLWAFTAKKPRAGAATQSMAVANFVVYLAAERPPGGPRSSPRMAGRESKSSPPTSVPPLKSS
jgi:hypothetical protein